MKEKLKKIPTSKLSIMSGSLAFTLTLSIIPILTLILMVVNLFGYSLPVILNNLSDFIPSEILSILLSYIPNTKISLSNIIVIITSFIISSRGSYTLITCSEILTDKDSDKVLNKNIRAFKMTILLIILILVTIYILAFGNYLLQLVLGNYITTTIGSNIYKIFSLLKWPVSILLIHIIIKSLYNMSVNYKSKKFINKGALFATIGWLLLTLLYMTYINTFTSYDIIYGSLSTIIVLIMWIYFLSCILIYGLYINTITIEKSSK